MFGCRLSALANITIVSDLPLPVVCQMTPPARLPSGLSLANVLHGGFDGKVLLVARNLLDAAIKDDKAIDQFQQPLGLKQVIERPILGGWQTLTLSLQSVKVPTYPLPPFTLVVELYLFCRREPCIDGAVDGRFQPGGLFLLPGRPKIATGAGGGVKGFVGVDGQQQLGKTKSWESRHRPGCGSSARRRP